MMNVIKKPTMDELNNICDVLKEGKLVVYPTDTIYGIAANVNDLNAIKKVYEVKQRDYNKPISICLHDVHQLKKLVNVNNKVLSIVNNLLPGPYTLLLKKKDNVSKLLTANTDIVGIRIPDNKVSHILTKNFPITSTSANLSNHSTPNNINEIKKQLKDNITTYIDCGIISDNTPSTIINLTGRYPKVIRGSLNSDINDILKIDLY